MEVTINEFSKLTGITSRGLHIYIKRGQCNRLENANFELDDPVNQAFIKKWSEYNKQKIADPGKKPAGKNSKKKFEEPAPEIKEPVVAPVELDIEADSTDGDDLFTINKKTAAANLEKKLAEIRLLKLKELKIAGEVVPIDLAQVIIQQIFQGFVTGFREGMEDLVVSIAQSARLNSEKQAELRAKVVQQINFSVDKTAQIAKKNMKAVVDEYSNQRGVGEHD